MRDFLIRVSGAQPDLLRGLPGERAKYEGLGGAILITSGLATLSMWFALSSAVGVNPVVSAVFAALWGLAIMSLDRWLVASMPSGGGRKWKFALPRVLMAVLLGAVISTPLVLQIFKAEIDAQVVQIKQRRANEFAVEQSRGAVGKEVARWRQVVEGHQKMINSGGDVPVDPSTDGRVRALTAERGKAQALAGEEYKKWQCQLYGGRDCPRKGDGVLAQAAERAYRTAQSKVNSLDRQIEDRRNELTATDVQSRGNRVAQARSDLPKAQEQLDGATRRQSDLQKRFDAENRAQGGLLIRLEALDQASGGDATLSGARFLLFLLFLMIECLPVAVKLMHRPGRYEDLLKAAEDSAFKAARAGLARSGGLHPGPGPGGPGVPQPGPAPAHNGAAQQTRSLQEIWRPPANTPAPPPPQHPRPGPPENEVRPPEPRSPAEPVAGYAAGPAAGPAGPVPAAGPASGPPIETGEHRSPDDSALRRVRDARAVPDSTGPGADEVVLYSKDDDDF